MAPPAEGLGPKEGKVRKITIEEYKELNFFQQLLYVILIDLGFVK